LEIWLTLNFTDSVDFITHLTLTPEFNFFLSLNLCIKHVQQEGDGRLGEQAHPH
jgi:hypothetical protein